MNLRENTTLILWKDTLFITIETIELEFNKTYNSTTTGYGVSVGSHNAAPNSLKIASLYQLIHAPV